MDLVDGEDIPLSDRAEAGVPVLPRPQRVSHPFFMYDMIRGIPTSFKKVVEKMRRRETEREAREILELIQVYSRL